MTTGEGAQAGRNQELRDDYRRLASLPTPQDVVLSLSEDQWLESNILLDQERTIPEVAEQMGVEPVAILMVGNARRCLDQYKWNPEALRRCLDGDER